MQTYLISDIFIIVKNMFFSENTMSTKLVKTVDVEVVPCFARFLEEQVVEQFDTAPSYNYKFPWELVDGY